MPVTGGEYPMENIMGCPECSMSAGVTSPVAKTEGHFQCVSNPMHKFKLGDDGFLKSL